jgi:hypothetical protein
MQESHRKDRADHPDPESCVGGRKAFGEALTGAHAGQPLRCEIRPSGTPTPLSVFVQYLRNSRTTAAPWRLRREWKKDDRLRETRRRLPNPGNAAGPAGRWPDGVTLSRGQAGQPSVIVCCRKAPTRLTSPRILIRFTASQRLCYHPFCSLRDEVNVRQK